MASKKPTESEINKATETGRKAFEEVSGQWTDCHRGKSAHWAIPRANPYARPTLHQAWIAGWNERNTAWCDAIYAA